MGTGWNIDDLSIVSNIDFYNEVSKGNVEGASIIHKFGHNDEIGVTLGVVSNAGVYEMPTAATSLEIVSSDIADNSAGAGARTVRIIGLDDNFNEITQDVPMNGLSAVAIPTPLRRVFRAYVTESGTYATTTTSSHVGVLTIRVASAGATWATINGIGGYAHSQTQIGSYTVPAGFTAQLLNTFIHVDSNKTVDFFLFTRENADDTTIPYDAMRIQSEFRGVEGSRSLTLKTPRSYPEKTDIIWLASVATGTADAAIDFEILLIDNNFL